METKRQNVFEKIHNFTLIIKKELGEIPKERLKFLVQRLANWQHKSKAEKKKIKLPKEAVMLLEVMLRSKCNPSTVYRWILLEESSLEIKEQLQAGAVSLRNASKLKKSLRGQLAINENQLRNMVLFEIDRYIEV